MDGIACYKEGIEFSDDLPPGDRVVDHGEERYSVPFFAAPNYHGDIGRYERELRGRTSVQGEPAQYGPWVDMRAKAKNFRFPWRNKRTLL